HPLFRTQYLLETLHDADRLLDAAALAQIEGDHPRIADAQPGERYVAGLDLAGPASASLERPAGDRDWTVLTVARVTAAHIEVVEHQAWQGAATEPLLEELADKLRRSWHVRHVTVDATGL